MPKIVDRQEMQNAILDAAMKTFSRKGYHAATISDVAAEAGLGKGTLYLYFRSKDAMTEALADRHFSALEQRYLDNAECESLEAFLESLRAIASVPAKDADFIRTFFEIFGPSFASDAFSSTVDAFFDRLGHRFAARIAALQQRGEIAAHHDADGLGRALAAMLDGLVLHRGLFRIPPKRYRAMMDDALAMFADGLRR